MARRWIVDAHREYGRGYIQSNELLSAFLELAKITRVRRCFFRALGLWPVTKSECGPIVGGLSCRIRSFLIGAGHIAFTVTPKVRELAR